MKVSKPVLIVAIGALSFSVYLTFFTGKKKVPSPASQPPQALQARTFPQSGSVTKAPAARPSDLKFAWGRDPFLRPEFFDRKISTKPVRTALKLEAILEGERGRVAVIDKQVVVKGDGIGAEKVLEIRRDGVVLVSDGSKRLLLLGEPRKEEQPVKAKPDREKK